MHKNKKRTQRHTYIFVMLLVASLEHNVYNPLRRQPETRILTWKNTPRSSSSTQDSKYSSNIHQRAKPAIRSSTISNPTPLPHTSKTFNCSSEEIKTMKIAN
ncbi:hypothetical protein KC19_11G075200 [Ceratodon purpureus]|uniref:Uncharacterized protein n=1 Tax=Ceratodon purpureus TaxID=3225 RepID=A0A8T0GFZ6_CERPU|nr:hypothetical protein KC19_11G075200 [Ceratodon purpureus]